MSWENYKEKDVIDKLINYYVEIEEYKKDLELQQEAVKGIVNEYLDNKIDIKNYKTDYVEVTMKNKKYSLNKIDELKYVKQLINTELKEVVVPSFKEDLIQYLAPDKVIFEEYRNYEIKKRRKETNVEKIRDYIIKNNKLEFLTISKTRLNFVVNTMLYTPKQVQLCKEISEKINKDSMQIRRLK